MSAAGPAPHPGRLREPVFPGDLVLTPVSRRPTLLEDSTLRTILDRPVPAFEVSSAEQPEVSFVVVTRDNLPFLRLCLESVLAHTGRPCELIVVDNGSTDGTAAYLERLAERNPGVRVITNDENRGFASACNQGAAIADAGVLVLLNDDTVVCDGWLEPLLAHLAVPGVGMVGPSTNRTGNEAQIDAEYRTWEELARFAGGALARPRGRGIRDRDPDHVLRRHAPRRCTSRSGRSTSASRPGCSRTTTTRVACARPATACSAPTTPSCITSARPLSGSSLQAASTPGCSRQTAPASRRSGRSRGKPYGRRQSDRYLEPGRAGASQGGGDDPVAMPPSSSSAGVTTSCCACTGGAPGTSRAATTVLTRATIPPTATRPSPGSRQQRAAGAEYIVFPATGAWWLDHYEGFRGHLDGHYERKLSDPETCFVFDLRERLR